VMYTPASYWDEIETIGTAIHSEEGEPREGRFEYWEIALRMFYDNPILGVGLANFPYRSAEYQSEEQHVRLGRTLAVTAVHSLYFAIMAELGIAGILVWGAILWCNVRDTGYVIRTAREMEANKITANDRGQMVANEGLRHDLEIARCYAHAIRAGLFAYLIAGTFLTVFHYPHFWLLTAVTVALKIAVRKRLEDEGVGLQEELEQSLYIPKARVQPGLTARSSGLT